MTRIVADIDDELNERFRIAIIKRFGSRKGALQRAVEEAVEVWLESITR